MQKPGNYGGLANGARTFLSAAFNSCAFPSIREHRNLEIFSRTYNSTPVSLLASADRDVRAPTLLTQALAALVLLVQNGFAAISLSDAVPHVDHATRSPVDLVSALFVFMLASFVGLEVIRRAPVLLRAHLDITGVSQVA